MTSRLWLIGIVVLIGSFSTTFWLAANGRPLAIFINSEISDEESITDAAISAGLRPALALRGDVEQVTRLNANHVRISGWSANPIGDGKPITVIAFIDGKVVLETRTIGPRGDVTAYLKLSDAAALNVVFDGVLSCRPRHRMFVVAVSEDAYAKLRGRTDTILCPS
jgi:hypothetical protein